MTLTKHLLATSSSFVCVASKWSRESPFSDPWISSKKERKREIDYLKGNFHALFVRQNSWTKTRLVCRSSIAISISVPFSSCINFQTTRPLLPQQFLLLLKCSLSFPNCCRRKVVPLALFTCAWPEFTRHLVVASPARSGNAPVTMPLANLISIHKRVQLYRTVGQKCANNWFMGTKHADTRTDRRASERACKHRRTRKRTDKHTERERGLDDIATRDEHVFLKSSLPNLLACSTC